MVSISHHSLSIAKQPTRALKTPISGIEIPPAFMGNAQPTETITLPKNIRASDIQALLGQVAVNQANGAAKVTMSPSEVKEVKASHILIEEKEPKKILQIKEEIESGKLTFEEAAKKYSVCPSKDKGGNLGFFSRGQMVKPFEEKAFEANVGELIGPVETEFGFHLIKVTEKR